MVEWIEGVFCVGGVLIHDGRWFLGYLGDAVVLPEGTFSALVLVPVAALQPRRGGRLGCHVGLLCRNACCVKRSNFGESMAQCMNSVLPWVDSFAQLAPATDEAACQIDLDSAKSTCRRRCVFCMKFDQRPDRTAIVLFFLVAEAKDPKQFR